MLQLPQNLLSLTGSRGGWGSAACLWKVSIHSFTHSLTCAEYLLRVNKPWKGSKLKALPSVGSQSSSWHRQGERHITNGAGADNTWRKVIDHPRRAGERWLPTGMIFGLLNASLGCPANSCV